MLIVAVVVFSSAAHGQCEMEKERVDRLNDSLKHQVTERARERHRIAKQDFLDCLRKPAEVPQTLSPHVSEYEKPYTTSPNYVPKRHKQTRNVTVSDYSNFNGKKKQAWYAYFTESQACLSNSNNMPIFVACAKVRKQHLKQFNARWNEQTEELMPLLDSK